MIAMLAKDKVAEEEEETKIFDEVWNHANEESYREWCEAIQRNFGAWKSSRYDRRHLMPPSQWCVKCKQVVKIKQNGMYQARLVACGYIVRYPDLVY